jgi:hypothetical protein
MNTPKVKGGTGHSFNKKQFPKNKQSLKKSNRIHGMSNYES